MSTFAEFAMEEQQAVVAGLTMLLDEILLYKPVIKDPEALKMLTALQSSLLAKRRGAGDALKHLRTAINLGEFKHIPAPVPDPKQLAANDPPEEPTEDVHASQRTLSVFELMQLELQS